MKPIVLFALIVITGLLFISGCDLAMLQNEDLMQTSKTMGIISEKIDDVQTGMAQWAEATGRNVDKVAELNEDIDRYQEVITEAKQKFDEAPTVLEGVIAANQVSSPVNPYSGLIDIILKTILGVTAGTGAAVAVKKNRDNKALKSQNVEVKRKYDATNKANDILRLNHPEIAVEHYNLVGEVRNGAVSVNNMQNKKEVT